MLGLYIGLGLLLPTGVALVWRERRLWVEREKPPATLEGAGSHLSKRSG